MITAGDGGVPLASADDPFDFFRLEVLRHLGESPLRHGRDGPREVTLRLSVLEEKPEEGAQGRHHQPGDFGAARAGVSQEETRDVVRGQFPDTDRSIPEAFDDETPDEGPVPGDRYRGKAAFFLEVFGILASERRQRGLVCRRLWRCEQRPLDAGVPGSRRTVRASPFLRRPLARRPSRNWLATCSCRSASARLRRRSHRSRSSNSRRRFARFLA